MFKFFDEKYRQRVAETAEPVDGTDEFSSFIILYLHDSILLSTNCLINVRLRTISKLSKISEWLGRKMNFLKPDFTLLKKQTGFYLLTDSVNRLCSSYQFKFLAYN